MVVVAGAIGLDGEAIVHAFVQLCNPFGLRLPITNALIDVRADYCKMEVYEACRDGRVREP